MIVSLSTQMCVFIDEAIQLEVACDWYDDPDLQNGGPPSKDQLATMALRLRTAYMNMSHLTGVDPCEQLQSTKDRLKRIRSAKGA
jgi:hypothetical protein